MKGVSIHPTATVEKGARIGAGTKVWHYAHVRENASIGRNCILGHCAYVDTNVIIGSNVKVGNKASVFQGVSVGDDAFIGPHVAFTNDIRPRSIGEWKIVETTVERGASVGANSTVLCGTVIGSYAMVGAGSVVTDDVPSHGLVYGNPARLRGFVCWCGQNMRRRKDSNSNVLLECGKCGKELEIAKNIYEKLQV